MAVRPTPLNDASATNDRERPEGDSAKVDCPLDVLTVRPRILFAARSPRLLESLRPSLESDGMRVVATETPTGLFRRLADHPSLVVLDLELGGDGLDLLRRLRASFEVPVVLVAANPRHAADGIVGLELGADDYLEGPVDPRELNARIRSILRRRNRLSGAVRLRPRTCVRFSLWELDCRTRRLSREGGASVVLTMGEFRLLNAFIGAAQRVLSRQDLLDATGMREDLSDRSIDAQVLRLRRKLQAGPDGVEVIATLRGLGYIFKAEVEAS
jgi:two-component system OmpR family response regulator